MLPPREQDVHFFIRHFLSDTFIRHLLIRLVSTDIRKVTSSCLCKYREGAGFPFQVESLEDGVDDAVDALYIHKANHGAGSSAHFDEAALNHVGGAQFPPQVAGKSEH